MTKNDALNALDLILVGFRQFSDYMWIVNYWTARANLNQMSEAQLLELADYLRPYANDVDVYLMWSAALLATED